MIRPFLYRYIDMYVVCTYKGYQHNTKCIQKGHPLVKYMSKYCHLIYGESIFPWEHTVGPRLLGWLGPKKVPDNRKKKSQSSIIGIAVLRGFISKKVPIIKLHEFFYKSRYCKDYDNRGPNNRGPPIQELYV